MKYVFARLSVFTMILLFCAMPALAQNTGAISASSYSAGDVVTVTGTIEPGAELFLSIAAKDRFAPKDTKGKTEIKQLAKVSYSNSGVANMCTG